MDTWDAVVAALLLLLGLGLGWWLAGMSARGRVGALLAERDLWARRAKEAEQAAAEERQAAAALAPLHEALHRLESQVHHLERDRSRQFGAVGEQLSQVVAQTTALREQTAGLAGALNASGTRGAWGEAQLRRVLEHAGMLARCDFEEQVGGVSRHDARVRPDVLVHLPGRKCLVIDAKAPMTAFLQAQAGDLGEQERIQLLRAHGRSLRGHVDTLASKAYWSAFTATPEMVVCFVPSDAVLATALQAHPDLYDRAQGQGVVLASPATLLALLRATAYAWKQEALTDNARDLLRLGTELHERLATLGRHVSAMGASLNRSVESYNRFVGTLETRVMVTSRRIHEMGLAQEGPEPLEVVQATPRVLTAAPLLGQEPEGPSSRTA